MSIVKLDPTSKAVEDIIKEIVQADYKYIVVMGQTQDGHLEISASDITESKIAWFILNLNKWFYNK
jgi:hypothetical protein